jgi:hypothetical protein
MKRGVVIGVVAAVAAVSAGTLAIAQVAPPSPDDRTAGGRQVPHYVDNADYDPQPYYVDGVQYKPANGKKKGEPGKAEAVKGKPAAAYAQEDPNAGSPDLHPYVPTKAQVASSASASHDQTSRSSQAAVTASSASSSSPTGRAATASVQHAAASSSSSTPYVPEKRQRYADAIIEAVDKVTAESVRFDAPLGKAVRYKGLIYMVRSCETSASDEPSPDVIAYLQVRTTPTDGPSPAPSKQVFQGWMFASSPGLNPLQHPVYDAWVVACRNPLPG